MSEALSEGAPLTGEVEAPASSPATTEVPVASPPQAPAAPEAPAAPASASVPKERFDGLMSEFQKTQARLQELERAQMSEAERLQAEKQDLERRLAELEQEAVTERLEATRVKLLAKNPELEVFGDLLYAETPEDMEVLAEDILTRLQAVKGGAPAAPAEQSPTAAAPVGASAPGYQGSGTDDIEAAKEKARATGNWSDYLRAKFLRQQMENGTTS